MVAENGWRNRVVDLYPYDAGTEQGSGWSLSNAPTVPQGVIESIRNTGRFLDNPIARLSFTSEQATDEEEGAVSPKPQSADYTVPLLVPPGTPGGPQGMLRILNGTDASGTVEIYAADDAGTRTGPATFTFAAGPEGMKQNDRMKEWRQTIAVICTVVLAFAATEMAQVAGK